MKVTRYEQFLKLKDKYDIERSNIMSLIQDYYNLNDDFRITHIGDNNIKIVLNVSKSDEIDYDSGEYFYWIEYYVPGGRNYDKLTQSEYDDMIKFIENPDVYKNSKKFNI